MKRKGFPPAKKAAKQVEDKGKMKIAALSSPTRTVKPQRTRGK